MSSYWRPICLRRNDFAFDRMDVRRYLTFMRTSLSSKGQIVLPAELRKQDHILPGQEFDVQRLRVGQYLLKKVPSRGSPGVLNWLRACPEKGWFQTVPSESTDQM